MKKGIKKNSRNGFGTKLYFIETGVLLIVMAIAMRMAWWLCGIIMDIMNGIGIKISGPEQLFYGSLWAISAIAFIISLGAFAFILYIVWKDYKRWRKAI